jgi:hypothetical protein
VLRGSLEIAPQTRGQFSGGVDNRPSTVPQDRLAAFSDTASGLGTDREYILRSPLSRKGKLRERPGSFTAGWAFNSGRAVLSTDLCTVVDNFCPSRTFRTVAVEAPNARRCGAASIPLEYEYRPGVDGRRARSGIRLQAAERSGGTWPARRSSAAGAPGALRSADAGRSQGPDVRHCLHVTDQPKLLRLGHTGQSTISVREP